MIVAAVGPYGGGGAVARIPSVMRSDEAWPAGHRAAASALTTAGFGPVAVAVVVAAKSPGREVQTLLSRIASDGSWLDWHRDRPGEPRSASDGSQLKPSEFARPHWAGSPTLRRTGRLCSHAPKRDNRKRRSPHQVRCVDLVSGDV